MKNQTYDRASAKRLVPLLTSIGSEIRERTRAVRMLRHRLDKFEEHERADSKFLNLKAELAEQLRSIRHAQLELDQLGCVSDEERPTRVLIPGADGSTESGFAWEMGDETIRRVQTSKSAA